MDPELLPRQKLMSLCLVVIGTMELDLQQKASTALLKLAACSSPSFEPHSLSASVATWGQC